MKSDDASSAWCGSLEICEQVFEWKPPKLEKCPKTQKVTETTNQYFSIGKVDKVGQVR